MSTKKIHIGECDAKCNQFKRWLDAPVCCLWEDQNGNPHWDVPKLLSMADLPATEENIRIVSEAIKKMMGDIHPNVGVIERWKESLN